MQDFEKLGVFYLGREFDLGKNALGENLVLYDSRDLVTHAVCVGMTGSGKTVTMAGVIQETGLPTLVMSHNKTLAAQLYGELRQFFPANAVEYFISYYDYYQPEAYVPTTDTYIEKDASINEDIDRLRLRATSSLMERSDVIVVASVSAIYGLGDPRSYRSQMLTLEVGQQIGRRDILAGLVQIQYGRNDIDFRRGTFRVRGDVVEVAIGSAALSDNTSVADLAGDLTAAGEHGLVAAVDAIEVSQRDNRPLEVVGHRLEVSHQAHAGRPLQRILSLSGAWRSKSAGAASSITTGTLGSGKS